MIMKKVKHLQRKMLKHIEDEYMTRDRSILVKTDNVTSEATIEVTLFVEMADRIFDRLEEKARRTWVDEFFNGVGVPRIREYNLVTKGH